MAGRRRSTAANALREKPMKIELTRGWANTPEECVMASCDATDDLGEPFKFETAGDDAPQALERISQELDEAGHGGRLAWIAGTFKLPGQRAQKAAGTQRARLDQNTPQRPIG